MEKRLFSISGLEVRAADNDTVATTVRGHAAVFNSDSQVLTTERGVKFVEQIAPGAFSRSLGAGHSILSFWNHNPDYPLGSTGSRSLTLSEDGHGLAFDLDSDRMTDLMRKTVAANDAKVSFGFRVVADSWERRADGLPVRTLLDVDLLEVSLTVIPAYTATEASFRSLQSWEAGQVAPSDSEAAGQLEPSSTDTTPHTKRIVFERLIDALLDRTGQ